MLLVDARCLLVFRWPAFRSLNHLTPKPLSWNDRYRDKPTPTKACQILTEFSAVLPASGRALDIACGAGRNCLYLAERGLHAVGVDRSSVALEQGRELARRKQVTVEWVQADLQNFALPPAAFDIIVCTYYRDPTIYARIRESLQPRGILFYETYSLEQLGFETGPKNPAHLLGPNELLLAFAGWDVILYREMFIDRGTAALIARKPATKDQRQL